MSKIGINANLGAIPDWSRFVRLLRGMSKTRVHLIMTGGTEPAKERQDVIRLINEVGLRNVQYEHRLYSREEGNWRNLTADKFRTVYKIMQPHDQIITEVPSNEAGATDNQTFVDDQLAHIAYALEAGQRIACGGVWGVGGPHESFIENGTYDRLYQAIHAANIGRTIFNARAYLDKHEYFYVWTECGAGFQDIPYDVMLDPATLRNHWRPKAAWDIRRERFLIRRADWEAIRCKTIGIPPIPILFSEYGWDGVDNPITQLNHLVKPPGQTPQAWIQNFGLNPNNTNTGFADHLRNKYIVPPYNGLRGVGAQRNIAKAIYPELTFPQYVEKILRHHNDDVLWPDHIFGAALFTWSWSGEWGGAKNTSGHNYGDEGLDDTLMTIGSLPDPTPLVIQPPTPVPTPQPVPVPTPLPESAFLEFRVRSTASDGQNIRSKTVLTPDTVIGKLPPPPTIVTIKAAPAGAMSDIGGLQWREIIYGALRGYVAWKHVEVVTTPPTPIPPTVDYKARLIETITQEIEYHKQEILDHTQEILRLQNAKANLEDVA